jgi:hypothetical protein
LKQVIARFKGRKGGTTPTHALVAALAMRIKGVPTRTKQLGAFWWWEKKKLLHHIASNLQVETGHSSFGRKKRRYNTDACAFRSHSNAYQRISNSDGAIGAFWWCEKKKLLRIMLLQICTSCNRSSLVSKEEKAVKRRRMRFPHP